MALRATRRKIIMTEDGNVVEIDERECSITEKSACGSSDGGWWGGRYWQYRASRSSSDGARGPLFIIVTGQEIGKMMAYQIFRVALSMREAEVLIQGAARRLKISSIVTAKAEKMEDKNFARRYR